MSGMEEGLRLTRRYAPAESASESGRWLAMDTNEMLRIGERNYLIRRLLTALDGHTRDEDVLPQRLKEPLQNGICQGERIADKALNRAIDTYYELRGMDRYGPTDTKLEQLGLSDLKGLIKR